MTVGFGAEGDALVVTASGDFDLIGTPAEPAGSRVSLEAPVDGHEVACS